MASKTLSNDQHRLLRRVKKVAYLIGLFLAMTIICLPGLWIVLSSLRPPVEIMAKPPVWIPQEITFEAYRAMFSGRRRRRYSGLGLFPQLADYLGHIHHYCADRRRFGWLCVCALPLLGGSRRPSSASC